MNDDKDEDRKAKLGFVPQREIVYNKLLPYADKLDEESTTLFTNIKTNLVKAFLAREIRPGCALWTSRLHKYMKIYGFKFSKEDHICLIKLFYELLTIPNLEPTRINKFAGTLMFLLKKKELLSRDELQLEWRPLFDLCLRVTKKTNGGIGMYRYLSTLELNLSNLFKCARIYFPANATQEILDEFRPKLCPYSTTFINYAIDYLESFLPVVMKQEEAHLGYKLWLEEFMKLWEECHNASLWENNMTWLMAHLSYYNIGYINWEPYVPIMFVRFVRTLQLPVGYRQKQCSKQFKIDISAMTLWIVSTLGGPTDTVFVHLEKFMQTIESYFHSANSGRWSPKLRDFIKKISLNFVDRVHNERYKKKTWEPEVPESHRLSDADIDRFVNIMKPSIEQLVYSRHHQDMTFTFNYLASLRPNLIVPILLDKLYASMESLTEPHKLTSAMMSVASVARYMVQGKLLNYPEGPTHVIPLLINLLPGIDPNDLRKCFMTFNFIVQFINMIPLINSSEASRHHDDLTEEEHIICEATAGFEDFVLQFFDRLCAWVESNTLETTRMEQSDHDRKKTKVESFSENALVSVISSVLTQCSPEIFTSALKKMHNFATNRIFEIKVSGKMVGIICQAFGRINPKETAKLFIPHICEVIENLIETHEDLLKEEYLDEELLYNLMLLSEIVDINSEILNYMEDITKILDKILFMTSQQGSTLGAHMLNLIMTTLTFIQPMEYRSSTIPFDTPVKDFLSIREWGKAGQIKKLDIKWYMPQEREIECVQMLLNRYLVPELEKLNKHSNGECNLSREELRKTFKVVSASLGCHTVLPIWNEPAMNLIDSVLDPWAFELTVGSPHMAYMPDGSNVRKAVADALHRVQKKILESDEGDNKSIFSIIHIYDVLLFNKFRGRDFEFHWKNFHTIKSLLEDKLHKRKMHLRHVLIDRVMLHQEFRNESRSCTFTNTHKQIMLDLFELAVSRYSEVRSASQNKLLSAVATFSYSYSVLMPQIKEILKLDSGEHHKKFKGCLFVLLGPKSTPIITRHDWTFIRDLWPLLVKSMPSEKLSIVALMDVLVDSVHRFFPTIAIDLEVSEKSLQVGYDLANNVPKVDLSGFESVIANGAEMLAAKCKSNLEAYLETLNLLAETTTMANLHWRYHLMAVCFLRDLVHPDVKYTPELVRFFLGALINDSIKIRKIALKVLLYMVLQNKQKFEKVKIEPLEMDNGDHVITPGIRRDNKWLLYNSETLPKNAIEWDKPRYVHDQHTGFYCWPQKLEVYAATDKQPLLDLESMCPQQLEIFNFFTNEDNIQMIIKYNSMEEKKGNDKFNSFRFLFFKNLFKIYEDKILPLFLPHLEKLVSDTQEQNHRCAAEIISGIISGSKHWSFEKTENLWKLLIPILKIAFNNLSEETLMDWAAGIAMGVQNRDPNRYHHLLEFLMSNLTLEQGSFLTCSCIYILQCALNQQPWRNAELSKRTLDYFKNHLSHPYQNVRDKISSSLANIFCKDAVFPNGNMANCPRVSEFFKEIMPTLEVLFEDTLKNLGASKGKQEVAIKTITNEENERESSIRLFKVVSKYVTGSLVRTNYSAVPDHYSLLPLACVLQSNDVDEELSSICTNLIAVFGNTLVLEKHLPSTLEAILKVAACPFWSARAVIAEFIPVFVFHNMATIISRPDLVEEILKVALTLLEDKQPEVRVKASNVISGFLHVNFIRDPVILLGKFKMMAKTKSSKLITRHAGVLGLCSYISSHPYDVPDFLPGIFEELGAHLNDPQPIPATIRKTLGDFKRTHHSNWENHKLKFTENELSVLCDLSVPPPYYA